MLKNVKEHLKQSNMTYWYHCKHASKHGTRLVVAGLKSYVHAVLPWFWKYDGPKTVIKIYSEMRRLKHLRRMMQEDNQPQK